MKKLIASLFTLILMLLATALAVPFLIPAEEYKQTALEFLKKKTGREVTVSGEIHFALLPNIALDLNNVTISNPAQGFTSPHLVKIEKLSLSVALMPLLSKEIQVQAVHLEKPEIWLEENRIGGKNWEFKTAERAADESTESTSSAKSTQKLKYDIEKFSLKNGSLHFLSKGDNLLAEKLNADWSGDKASLNGQMNFRGMPWQLAATVKHPQAAILGEKTPLALLLESAAISIALDGEMKAKPENLAKTLALTGKLNISAPSLKELATSLQMDASKLPQGEFSLQTIDAHISPTHFKASPVSLILGDVEATGTLGAQWGGKTPTLTGALSFPELDFSEDAPSAGSTTAPAESAASSENWDSTPIDFSGLRKAGLDMDFTIQSLKLSALTLSNVGGSAKLKSGKLNLQLDKASFLHGTGQGTALLDASDKTPSWQLEAKLNNIEAAEALAMMMDNAAITGPVTANLALAASGNSQQQWMQRLHGAGKISLQKGTIQGYSLPALFRNLKPEETRAESTQDANITLEFLANNGVVSLTEGTLEGRGLKAGLSGNVDMGNRRVDLLLRPKMLPQYDAENIEKAQEANLMVPVKIVGRFGHISARPDAKAALMDALQNPDQAKQNVEVLKKEGEAILDTVKDRKKIIDDNLRDYKKNKGLA